MTDARPGSRQPRRIDFAAAVANCAPDPRTLARDIADTARRRGRDPHEFAEELVGRARRAA